MKREVVISALVRLGEVMTAIGDEKEWPGFTSGLTKEEYDSVAHMASSQKSHNGWFIPSNVRKSIRSQGHWLSEDTLLSWSKDYAYSESPKTITIIMAGNIPLVGFHDLICVLMSGNNALCKLSSDDEFMLPALIKVLDIFSPELAQRVEFSNGPLNNFDAVIATGSDNSSRYFDQYFGKYPHVFRKNRTSLAVLTGEETKIEIERLGLDIFSYFGLGCRNVSQILIPRGYDFKKFFEGIFAYSDVINHNKYANNYDYNKSVYLLNQIELFDNNFLLLRESKDLFSPLAMLNYSYYDSGSEVTTFIDDHESKIQVVVGSDFVPFGQAQQPNIDDYADGVDTMKWLSELD